MVKKPKSHLRAEDHQHRNGKLSLNHSVSTTSITSIDLCTYGSDAQSDRDFQNRSLLRTLLGLPSRLCPKRAGWWMVSFQNYSISNCPPAKLQLILDLDISLYLLGESLFLVGACIYCGKQFLGYGKAAVLSFCLLAFLAFLGNKEGNAAQA